MKAWAWVVIAAASIAATAEEGQVAVRIELTRGDAPTEEAARVVASKTMLLGGPSPQAWHLEQGLPVEAPQCNSTDLWAGVTAEGTVAKAGDTVSIDGRVLGRAIHPALASLSDIPCPAFYRVEASTGLVPLGAGQSTFTAWPIGNGEVLGLRLSVSPQP